MRVFIDFWKLETENSLLHVFSFLHKLSFENSFYFLSILSCQTSFLVSKIENYFWKQKTREKNSYQTYPNFFFFFYKNVLKIFSKLMPVSVDFFRIILILGSIAWEEKNINKFYIYYLAIFFFFFFEREF